MDITITSQQILALAALIGAITAIWGVASKPFKTMKDIGERISKMEEKLNKMSRSVEIQGDMVYQLLDHAATQNNTGEMQRALDEYNAVFRHGGHE